MKLNSVSGLWQVADGLKAAHATRTLQDMAKEQGSTSVSQRELSVVVHLARSLAEMKAGGASIHEQVLPASNLNLLRLLKANTETHRPAFLGHLRGPIGL